MASVRPTVTGPALAGPPSWIVGPRWSTERLRQPGWLLLPLRGFLGVTFLYASLQKLANPDYLNPHSPTSVVGQIRSLRQGSPIGPLLGLSEHAPTLVGLLIACGELAVAIGVLLGLWTRLAAVGGMALSLTFFLTVSWNTTPYYYGSDIVFFFAWTVIAAFGASGVLSVDGWLGARARTLSGLRPKPTIVAVETARLRALCPRDASCGLTPDGACHHRGKCPVFPVVEHLSPARRAEVDRRTLLLGARAAGVVAILAGAVAGLTAAAGRAIGGTASNAPMLAAPKPRRPAPTHPARKSQSKPQSKSQRKAVARAAPPPGTPIGSTSAVPVGEAARFTDPASGNPAWIVHPRAGKFVAFSAVCTHAGCTVQFDRAAVRFVCPCHGGTYDARTGRVLGGPPPSPLPAIPVHIANGEIRVD